MPLPISAIIPTADRPDALATCLATLSQQTTPPVEIVVADASASDDTRAFCAGTTVAGARVQYLRASSRGAAVQRSEGLDRASQPFVLFVDDDVELEVDCVARLWAAIQSDTRVGGVSSMLVNQRYRPPGPLNRWVYRIAAGERVPFPAGRCLGPAVTVFPSDRDDLPEINPVEWLNTTCTLYRRSALPSPLFPAHFHGYSLGEDVHLSLSVGKRWRLVNARTARVFHRSRSGPHKPGPRAMAAMSTVNRHYLMTRTLGRTAAADYARFTLVELADIVGSFRTVEGVRRLPSIVAGKLDAVARIVASR